MPRALLFVLLLLAMLSAACTPPTHRIVTMPMIGSSPHAERPPDATGSLTLVFSRRTTGIVASIDGTLVADGLDAERLTVRGLDSGYVDLALAADGVERTARVWIEAGRDTAVPVGNAGAPKQANPVVMTALSVVAFLISRAATDLLF